MNLTFPERVLLNSFHSDLGEEYVKSRVTRAAFFCKLSLNFMEICTFNIPRRCRLLLERLFKIAPINI